MRYGVLYQFCNITAIIYNYVLTWPWSSGSFRKQDYPDFIDYFINGEAQKFALDNRIQGNFIR